MEPELPSYPRSREDRTAPLYYILDSFVNLAQDLHSITPSLNSLKDSYVGFLFCGNCQPFSRPRRPLTGNCLDGGLSLSLLGEQFLCPWCRNWGGYSKIRNLFVWWLNGYRTSAIHEIDVSLPSHGAVEPISTLYNSFPFLWIIRTQILNILSTSKIP